MPLVLDLVKYPLPACRIAGLIIIAFICTSGRFDYLSFCWYQKFSLLPTVDHRDPDALDFETLRPAKDNSLKACDKIMVLF